jgi:hypothetical protein
MRERVGMGEDFDGAGVVRVTRSRDAETLRS